MAKTMEKAVAKDTKSVVESGLPVKQFLAHVT